METSVTLFLRERIMELHPPNSFETWDFHEGTYESSRDKRLLFIFSIVNLMVQKTALDR